MLVHQRVSAFLVEVTIEAQYYAVFFSAQLR